MGRSAEEGAYSYAVANVVIGVAENSASTARRVVAVRRTHQGQRVRR
ncbi:hypothetical protein ACIP5Y_12065 [Nocardia sp. NPDC088792]